ncbi:DUF4337 domain-containing protein [Terricaulis sp.]|uniref:DUF4337 domain-containing protein n=1 Tax=Terricaulis sp. TaxID=2768686 RepID=UPI00378477A4
MADAEADAKSHEGFNNLVALTIAVLATFMAISAIKASNIEQAITQAEAERNNSWAWYQAVRVREDMATYQLSHLERLARTNHDPEEAARLSAEITAQNVEIAHVRARKDEVQARAQGAEAQVSELSVFDDQYDISTAIISIALSLLAVCVLVRARWLFGFSLLPAVAGVAVAALAMAHIPLHMDRLVAWLT